MCITVGIKNVPFRDDLERRIIRGGGGVGRLRGGQPAIGQEREFPFSFVLAFLACSTISVVCRKFSKRRIY